jgi:hypothetical protein
VFLTAAHCVMGVETPFYVTFETEVDEDSLDPSELLPGTAYWAEGAWAGGMSDVHDLAVVVLDDPVVGIIPATLPTASLNQSTLRGATFTAVGYGATRETRQGGGQSMIPIDGIRRYATQGFLSLQKAWLLLSMNPAIGSGGACYGDSGGPHFLGGVESHLIVSITVTGDMYCKATDKTYRLDTPEARAFLGLYLVLP